MRRNRVPDDFYHRKTSTRVENIPFFENYAREIINRPAGRKVFPMIRGEDTEKI